MSQSSKTPPQSTPQSTPQATAQSQSSNKPDALTFTDEFKDAVREYCEKDDQRLKLQKELKDIRAEIKDLEDTIVKFMKDNNLPIFDTGEKGLFENKVQQGRKGLSKPLIIEALSKCQHLKDPTKAEEVAKFIYDSRPVEEKVILKRK